MPAARIISVTLRIFSRHQTADEITGVLDVQPTSTSTVGEPLSPRNPGSALASHNAWKIEVTGNHASVDSAIDELSRSLFGKLSLIEQLPEAEVDIFVGLDIPGGQCSIELSRASIRFCASIGAEVILDTYSPEGVE